MIKCSELRHIRNPRHQTPEIKTIIQQQMSRDLGDHLGKQGIITFQEFQNGDDFDPVVNLECTLYVATEDELKHISQLLRVLDLISPSVCKDTLKELHELIFKQTKTIF